MKSTGAFEEYGAGVELEVRSSGDDAWYNAEVELLDNGIYIRFQGFGNEEDEEWNVAYLSRFAKNIGNVIRTSSPQLQDYQCDQVTQGTVVCARLVQDLERGEEAVKYFDAKITKVVRREHSIDTKGEECCKCIFQAHWLTGPERKKVRDDWNIVILSCDEICLPTQSIMEEHPLVRKILDMIENSITATDSSCLSDSESPKPRQQEYKRRGKLRPLSPIPRPGSGEYQEFSFTVTSSVLEEEVIVSAKQDQTKLTSRKAAVKKTEAHTKETFRKSTPKSCSVEEIISLDTAGDIDDTEVLKNYRAGGKARARSSPAVKVLSPMVTGKGGKAEAKISPEMKVITSIDTGEDQKKMTPTANNRGRKAVLPPSESTILKRPPKRMRGSVDEFPSWFKPAGGLQA